ncbi:MAG: hypothetical protein EHJ95_03270, partial [Methanobacteriota archaeon]
MGYTVTVPISSRPSRASWYRLCRCRWAVLLVVLSIAASIIAPISSSDFDPSDPSRGASLHAGDQPVNGTLLWSQGVGRRITSTSISTDGAYIVAGTHRRGMVALYDREGELFWNQDEGVPIAGVSIAPDGSYVGVAADRLYLLYPHGGIFWVYNSGYFPYSVAVAADGAYVAAGFDDGAACLFSREGEMLWSYPTEENVRSIAIAADASSVVAGTDGDQVYMLDGSGNLIWSYSCGADVRSVSVSSDGTAIAAGSADRQVYFFDAQGMLLWKRGLGGRINAVSVSPDGSYVAACSGNIVEIYDRSGNLIWRYMTDSLGSLSSFSSTGSILGAEATSVALSANGTYLIVGTGTGDQAIHLFSIFDTEGSSEEAPEQASDPAALQRNHFFAPPGDPEETALFASVLGITTAAANDQSTVAVRMAVSPEWVDIRDGPGGVRITRWTGEGSPEILNTTFVGHDLGGRYVFEAVSSAPVAKYGVTAGTAPGIATG